MIRIFCLCLVIVGIHSYLGIHILARKVIFVDLAMGQIAVLGATYAMILGYDPTHHPETDTVASYLFSLGFTVFGAAVFAFVKMKYERVPQEAFIGIVYASAAAFTLLILAKSTTAGEQIKNMLAGERLLVDWSNIVKASILYSVLGLVYWIFNKKFIAISFDPEKARKEGLSVWFWDFIFYLTLGLVITISVRIAGVLLVFSYLVVPAAIGFMFADSFGARLIISWFVGTIISVTGILISFSVLDLPTGPSVVVCFAVAIILAGILRFIFFSKNKLIAILKIIGGVCVLTCIFFLTTLFTKSEEPHFHQSIHDRIIQSLRSDEVSLQIDAIHHIEESYEKKYLPELVNLLRRTKSDHVISRIVRMLPGFNDNSVVPVLKEISQKKLDGDLRFEIAQAILKVKDPHGIPILIELIENDETYITRENAINLLKQMTGETFEYNPELHGKQNAESVRRWKEFWNENKEGFNWSEEKSRFE